jgi:hypothetical protein
MTDTTKPESASSPSAVAPELEKKEPTLNEPLNPTSPQAPKEPVKLTLEKNELINVLEYAETLAMITIRESQHPGVAWAGGKLLDHLTEAKHWVYEIQLLPPMPKSSPIVTPRDFLKKK